MNCKFLRYKPVLLTVCLLQFFNSTVAQKLRFERFTVDEGLQNNIVFATAEDAKGLIWFASSTGIDRFDGNNFVNYPLPVNNGGFTNYISIPYLVADYKKRIWAASSSNIYLYNTQKDAFEWPVELNNLIEKKRSITGFYTGNGGKFLLAGTSNLFFVYNTETGKIVLPKQFDDYVRYVFQDNKGIIWVSTNKTVHRFIINDETLSELKDEAGFINQNITGVISIISQDKSGRLWIGTNDGKLYVYDEVKNTGQRISFHWDSPKPYAVKDIYHDGATQITYVTADGGGLALIKNDLTISSIYQSNEDDLSTLSNNAAYDIFSDSYKRLWVTTYGGGVNVVVPEVQPFRNLLHEMNNPNSLSNNAAKAITQDANGNIWFGTRKGISRWNQKTNQWNHYNEASTPGFSSDNVLVLTANNKNEIWAGTYGGGVIQINAATNQVKSYLFNEKDSASLGTDYIYTLLYDSKERLWAAGRRGPLSYLNSQTGKFVRLRTSVAGINYILEDAAGEILLGTERGVWKVVADSMINLFPKAISEKVIHIAEEKPGVFWVGTLGGGLILVDKSKGIISQFKTIDGLPSDVICGFVKDNDGDIWIGTSKGIAHFQRKENKFTSFSKADGMAGSQVNFGAVYKTKDGDIIFGTTSGFSLFNPQRIGVKGFPPHIVFTGLTVNNKKISTQDEKSFLPSQLDELPELKLKYYQNSLTIDFINTSPAVSGKHLYSWKLEGFDKEWSQPSAIPTAVYTNLESGKYTLLVKAVSKGGEEVSNIRKLPIVVKAPWWASGWAFVGYLLLLTAGAFMAYNYLQIKNARKKFAERLRLNTSISHEIRTPLTLIKGPVNALSGIEGISEEQRHNMQLAQKNILKLEAIVSQFIDFQKIGVDKMQMQVKDDDILALLDEVTESFVPLMKEKNIHFTYKRPSEQMNLLFDRDKMEKVFNNLISNAVKYTPSKNDITVSAAKDDKNLYIVVADTGIGIPPNQQHLIFKGYFRADNTVNIKETGSGIGLSVARELIEMHHGNLSFKSENGKGTMFTVVIPLHNEALKQFLVKEKINRATEMPELGSAVFDNVANKKILVAEDNDELRNYLEQELTRAGFKVLAAPDGAEALKLLKKSKVDIVLTDVMMPEMNGFQLCAAIKREISTCHIPVIMLTAIHDRDYLLEGYRSGADDYVKKPFDLAYILTRIDNLLADRLRFRNKIMSVFEHSENGLEDDADVNWLKSTTEMIVENMDDEQFSVEKLCKLMGTSRPVLFRKFKAITGEAPQQYIMQLRLRKAVELLKQKKYNINEIAFMVGFTDPKYFSTAFKKHFGKTPKEYAQEEG